MREQPIRRPADPRRVRTRDLNTIHLTVMCARERSGRGSLHVRSQHLERGRLVDVEQRYSARDFREGRIYPAACDEDPRACVAVVNARDHEQPQVSARDGREAVEVEDPANLGICLEPQTQHEPVVGEHDELIQMVPERSIERRGDDDGAALRIPCPHPRERRRCLRVVVVIVRVRQSRVVSGGDVSREHARDEGSVFGHGPPRDARELRRIRRVNLEGHAEPGEFHELEVALHHGVLADVRMRRHDP